MKRKVIFVITKSNFGGAQRYVFDLATSFKNEYDVAVAFGGTGLLGKKLQEAGIRTILLPSLIRDVNPFLDFKTFIDLIRMFRKEKPDVVHLNSSKIGAIGSIAARIARMPRIVFTGHGWAFNEDRAWFGKKIIIFAHWMTIMCSHVTIAVADKIRKDILRLPFVKNRIQVIHNGIPPLTFFSREEARQKLNLPNGFLIGTLSELHKNKGLDYAIEGFAAFHKNNPESHFVVMGEGEERANLEALIKKLGLESSVHLLGFVIDASKYLKALDVFTLSSRTEAFPYVIIEAGAAGLPILASRVGGIPEAIVDGTSGILVDPQNPFHITQGLNSLTSDIVRAKYAKNIQDTVLQNFSLKNTVDKTRVVYEGK